MSKILTTRRGLITGLVAFIAAPAIVRASSLMPIKQVIVPQTSVNWELTTEHILEPVKRFTIQITRLPNGDFNFGEWVPVETGEASGLHPDR